MAKKKFYLAPPQDDVYFLQNLRETHADEIQTIPSREKLQAITRDQGIDTATGILYLSLLENSANGSWLTEFEKLPVLPYDGPKVGKVLIIPAMFYNHYPEVGGAGPHILEIAQRCGFESELLKTVSLGSPVENAKLLCETLIQESSQNIWLVSLSRGGLEVRLAIENHHDRFPFQKIKGWINTCGFPSGNSMTDIVFGTWWGKRKWQIIGRLLGTTGEAIFEMGARPWKDRPFPKIPSSLKVVSVVPFAREWHVQTSLTGRFKLLSSHGPNDGITTIRDSIIDGYPVYPLWASDHFFRSDKVIPLLYRLFRWMRDQSQ